MINKIKSNDRIIKLAELFATVFVFYRLSLNLIYAIEQTFQTPRDLDFFHAVFWLFILIFCIRKITFKKIDVWITIGAELALIAGYLYVMKISPATYGPDYFKTILYGWITCAAFVAVLIDVFRYDKIKEILKYNGKAMIPFLVLSVVFAIFDRTRCIPIVCPIVALLLTRIDKQKWLNLVNCFAVGYYIAFAHLMTKSLLFYSGRVYDGRWLGIFSELENGGVICGGAVICMLYFISQYIISDDRKWYKLAVPISLLAYPLYAVLRIGARSAQLSITFVGLLFFIFIHKSKEKKIVLIRLSVAITGIIVAIIMLYVISHGINKRLERNGDIELSYLESHLMQLTSGEEDGYFGKGTILTGIDRLSSGRLSHWWAASQQIRLWGHPIDMFAGEKGVPLTGNSPHNLYIKCLIEYGIMGGGIVIAWMLYLGVIGVKGVLAHENSALMMFLWLAFCLGIFTFTSFGWRSPHAFILLIMQYGLCLINLEKEKGR